MLRFRSVDVASAREVCQQAIVVRDDARSLIGCERQRTVPFSGGQFLAPGANPIGASLRFSA